MFEIISIGIAIILTGIAGLGAFVYLCMMLGDLYIKWLDRKYDHKK